MIGIGAGVIASMSWDAATIPCSRTSTSNKRAPSGAALPQFSCC